MDEKLERSKLCSTSKIVITGGAGLVGQNLAVTLEDLGYTNVVVIDKHSENLNVLKERHPRIKVVDADLADAGDWINHFSGASTVVTLHAQIGGKDLNEFLANNVRSTENVISAVKIHNIAHLVHVSSSVVESAASDFYTQSKKEQEELVQNSCIPSVILRPTLMFGWFDRKHLGWLSKFMRRLPVFPVPGDGCYLRQPLYVGDLCKIIVKCIDIRVTDKVYDISGLEEIDYIDIIKAIKRALGSRTVIIRIPYRMFWVLLWAWGLFDRNPPFTTQQLEALVARDEFEVIDWPGIFGVEPTPFEEAINTTFCDPRFSEIAMKF